MHQGFEYTLCSMSKVQENWPAQLPLGIRGSWTLIALAGWRRSRLRIFIRSGERSMRNGYNPGCFRGVFAQRREENMLLHCIMLRSRYLHDNWEFSCKTWESPSKKLGFSVHEWRSAHIPGHIHSDLIRHGIIADPFDALYELGCQWVDEEDWSYRTNFNLEPDSHLPRRKLIFEGLDTVCELLVNGEIVASHDNMFLPLELDISEQLHNGTNEIRVDFKSAAIVGSERRSEYFSNQQIAASVRNFDERAFVRKAQYMFGWDWGPRLVSVGIWRPVTLVEYLSRITDVHVSQEHFGDGTVELAIMSQIEGSGDILHYLEGSDDPLHDGEVIRITQPRLWWPAGLGEQHLYSITTFLIDGSPSDSREQPVVLDRRVTRFGLRRASLIRVPDTFGESFELEVNGSRLWALGANWIPDHSLPSNVNKQRVERQLIRARDLNMNMLRVWGGGCYESDEFYSACDELGLLVWQDFPYACSYYPEDENSLIQARKEAEVNIVRLRNHPSLVLWCGNNENLTMFESKWGGADNQPPRYFGAAIYDNILPDVLAKLDGTRPYISSSPWGGSFSNAGGTGDQHTWDVWHGRGDWKYYADSTARFSSEFGFAAAPTLKVWRKIMPSDVDLSVTLPGNAIARWHDKTAKGFETFAHLVELHYPHSENLEQWSYYSQLNQRDALRFGIEHFRRSQFCRGTLIWQFNDCWPAQSWALLDSSGAFKAAAFEIRRLYAPLLASLEQLEDSIRLWAILDNSDVAFSGPAKLEAHCLTDGSLIARWETSVNIAPGQRQIILEADISKFDRRSTIITALLHGSNTFRLMAEPRDTLFQLPQIVAHWSGSILQITSDLPVVDLHCWDQRCECELLDDFVTLPTRGSVRLRTRGKPSRIYARSLAGHHAVELQTTED